MITASRLALVGWMLTVVVAVTAWAADTPSNMPVPAGPADLLKPVRRAIQERDWGKALVLLQEASSSGLDSADLHNLLGYTLRMKPTPEVQLAIKHYRFALARNPTHLGAHEYLGEAYLMYGDLAAAQNQLRLLGELCGRLGCEEYRDLQQAIESCKASQCHQRAKLQ